MRGAGCWLAVLGTLLGCGRSGLQRPDDGGFPVLPSRATLTVTPDRVPVGPLATTLRLRVEDALGLPMTGPAQVWTTAGSLGQGLAVTLDAAGEAAVMLDCNPVTFPECRQRDVALVTVTTGTVSPSATVSLVQPATTRCTKSGNKAVRFSGAQYLMGSDAPSLHLSDLTLEAWVRFAATSSPGYNFVLGKPVGSGTADSWGIWYEGGALLSAANAFTADTGVGRRWDPAADTWYHLAYTFDQGTHTQRLYLNGVELAANSSPLGDPTYDGHPFFIGADLEWESPGGFFRGDIDEVRIWSQARTQEEVVADGASCTTGTAPGLVAYFPLDEGAGQLAQDASGNGHTVHLGATTAAEPSDPQWITSDVPF